jgi:hypothetical protein
MARRVVYTYTDLGTAEVCDIVRLANGGEREADHTG